MTIMLRRHVTVDEAIRNLVTYLGTVQRVR